jgi:chromosome segregation ATPase
MKNMIRNLTRQVEGTASTLAKAEGDEQMAEQKVSQIQDKVNKEQGIIDETSTELAELDEEHQAKLTDVAALEMMIDQDSKKIASLKVEVSEDDTTYAAKDQALTEQENALAAEIAQKGKTEMLVIKGKYLKEERAKLAEFKSKVDEKKYELEKLEQSVNLATDRITKMQSRRNATYNTKRGSLNEVIQKATAESNALTAQLTTANTTLSSAITAVTAARKSFDEIEKKHQVAENTLPLSADTLKEKQAKLAEATEEEKEARADKRKLGIALGRAVDSTDGAIQEMNSTWAYVNETTAKLTNTSMELSAERKDINSQQFNHSKAQPFIVRHHDLAPPRP